METKQPNSSESCIKSLIFCLSSLPFNSEDDFLLFWRPVSPHRHLTSLLHTLFGLCSLLLADQSSTTLAPSPWFCPQTPVLSHLTSLVSSTPSPFIYSSVSRTVAPLMLLSWNNALQNYQHHCCCFSIYTLEFSEWFKSGDWPWLLDFQDLV